MYAIPQLRNRLVHDGAMLEAASNQKEVRTLAKTLPDLSYDDEDEVFIISI